MTNLTFNERKIIEKMLNQEAGVRAIGRILGRVHSSISDEIKRNKMHYEARYDAEIAQARSLRRNNNKGNKKLMDQQPQIKAYVIEKMLEDQWSPEQIAGQLSLIHHKKVISHETIYQFIYSDEGKELKLWLHLRRKRKPIRQKQCGKKKHVIIKERISIHQRLKPKFGDIDTDLMVARSKEALSVQVEHDSLRCVLTSIENKKAYEKKRSLRRAIEEYGETNVHSITFDNGSENVIHREIRNEYNIPTYFCDPYSWWQKGRVENTIGLVRQYLPKRTDLSKVTEDQIYIIQEKLNNRPRKKLGWFTPNQAFQILAQGGRIRA